MLFKHFFQVFRWIIWLSHAVAFCLIFKYYSSIKSERLIWPSSKENIRNSADNFEKTQIIKLFFKSIQKDYKYFNFDFNFSSSCYSEAFKKKAKELLISLSSTLAFNRMFCHTLKMNTIINFQSKLALLKKKRKSRHDISIYQ